MKKYHTLIMSILLSLLSSITTFANADNNNVRDGFYFGAAYGAGAAFIGFAHDTYGAIHYDGGTYQFTSGYAWKTSPKKTWAIEADFINYYKAREVGSNSSSRVQYLIPWTTVTTTTQTDSSSTAQSISLFASLNNYAFNNSSNLFLIAKFGLGLMTQHFVQTGTKTEVWNPGDTTVNPINIDQTGVNLMFISDAGVGYNITKNIAITGEIQNAWGSLNYIYKVVTFNWAGVDVSGLPTFAFLAGLNFRF